MIAVVLEGGLVQAVITDDPARQGEEVMVIDRDIDGADDDEVTEIDGATGDEAIVSVHEVERSAFVLADIMQAMTDEPDVEIIDAAIDLP